MTYNPDEARAAGYPPPDRLSVNGGVFHDLETAKRINVFFDDVLQRNRVVEYCVSEGWLVRYKTDKLGRRDRDGRGYVRGYVTERVEGVVRVEWQPEPPPVVQSREIADEALRQAALKRARKAANQAKGMQHNG